MAKRRALIWPALISLIVAGGYVSWRLAATGFDPSGIAELGTRYRHLDPAGSPGYDGQFAYYIAQTPDPAQVAPHLDVPAYRYQRILYPMLARALALGKAAWIPWALIIVNLAALALGTCGLAAIFRENGVAPVYALSFGLWVGMVSAVGLDLHEPLAFALVAAGWWARDARRPALGAALLSAALFAKETTLAFWAAAVLADLFARRFGRPLWVSLMGGFGFVVWQGWLYLTFGAAGLSSGGAMATPFEWLPFAGLWRIGAYGWKALALYAVIFIPLAVLPSLTGVIVSLKRLKGFLGDASAWSLMLNALIIVFLPFSTFREPLGMVRILTGLMLAWLLFAGESANKRVLNYALFTIPMLVLLAGG